MEKFGIFDLINKLSLQNNQPNTNSSKEQSVKPITQKTRSNAYKSTIALLKKHDEISKRIDKNNR